MAKNEENGLAFFTELQAYIEANGHLPNKHVSRIEGCFRKQNTSARRLRLERLRTGWE